MEYRMLRPKDEIRVAGLFSLHYFQFAQGYVFGGERHDFWEMVYIDRGEAEIGVEKEIHRLGQGQLLFHKPGEFHTIWANYAEGANLFVLSFACKSAAMSEFRGKQFTLRAEQRQMISRMIAEGRHAFGDVLDISDQKELIPRDNAPRGGTQMIVLYLTQLLISLLRASADETPLHVQPRLTEEEDFLQAMEIIRGAMHERLDGSLRFPELCRRVGWSATTLKERFRRQTGMTVMDYYRHLRLEEARRLLREGRQNISQIAETLGYANEAAFCRQFRHVLGLTPTAYQRSVYEG